MTIDTPKADTGEVERVAKAGNPMATAPRDGTHFLAYLYHAPDSQGRGEHGEWREIWWKTYRDPIFGHSAPWHAGDDFDLRERGVGDCHMGEAVPIAWLPLPNASAAIAALNRDHAHGLPVEAPEIVTPAFGMWQPIETAPKVGWFIAIVAAARVPCIVSWQSGKWCEKDPDDFDGYDEPEEVWIEYWKTYSYNPTHWMPLPPRPGDYLDDRSHSSVHVIKAALNEGRGEKVHFDPFAGCSQCTWNTERGETRLMEKCELHQKIEDLQINLGIENQCYRDVDAVLGRILRALGGDGEDNAETLAAERMEEIRSLEEEVAKTDALAAEKAELREALKPFAAFAENVDENGWTSNIHRDRISTWLGPSDFRRARDALAKAKGGEA